MRLTLLRSVAAVSLLIASAGAATRPHYGGTLHVATTTALTSLDPADSSHSDTIARRNISRLLFDTLAVVDNRGVPQPGLAISWQSDSNQQRWQFSLRPGVTFQDGSLLNADVVAAALRMANPAWKVVAAAGMVSIEVDSPAPSLLSELALPRNSIVRRDSGKLSGTGPFVVTRWDAGRRLTVTARDDYWHGRAFLDSIEIEMGKNLREQQIALDLGRNDVIEIAPEQFRRAGTEGRHVEDSAPMELVALAFSREPRSPDEARLRETLSLSIDRAQLSRVLLQGGGEPTGSLLPGWLTGYSFLFSTEADLPRAKQIRAELRQAPAWTLGYDAADPMSRVVAERIVLNARDAGITLQPTAIGTGEVRLVRVPLASLDGRVALSQLSGALGLPQPRFTQASPEALYSAENSLLQSKRVVPLLHLRVVIATSAAVQNWSQENDGSWRLSDTWLMPAK